MNTTGIDSAIGNTSTTRRRLLKALIGTGAAVAVGRALPEQWIQPVIEAAVLPAHAQATGLVFGGAGLASGVLNMLTDHRTRFAQLTGSALDLLVPRAHAVPVATTSTVCAVLSGNILDVTLQRSANNARRQGPLNIDGTTGCLGVIASSPNCTGTPADLSAFVSGFVAGVGFTLNVTSGLGFTVYVPLTGVCPGFAALDGSCPQE